MSRPRHAEDRSYANEALRGSIWTTVQVGVSKAGAAAATFFLGFLLQPADFGVAWFAISAGSLATGLHVLAALDVLIASPRGFGRIAGTMQLMALLTALAEMLVVAALALVLSREYPERAGLLALMLVVAIRPLTDAMNVLPMAKMRLGLEYPRLAAIDAITTLVGSLGAIGMAFAGLGAMSIVLPPIAATGLRGALYWWHTGPFVENWRSNGRGRPLASRFAAAAFGSYMSGVLLILDTTILGIFVTPSSLGLFAFASGIATQVNGIISYQIAGSLHPILAHLRNAPERQVVGLLRACRLIACVLVPILLMQVAVAGPVFRTIWGTRWDAAVPVFMTISLGQAFMVCLWPASFTLKAQGRFRGYMKLQLLHVVLAGTGTALAAARGGPVAMAITEAFGQECTPDAAEPIAVAIVTAAILACVGPVTLWLACRQAGTRFATVLDTMFRPWIAAIPFAILGGWLARTMESGQLDRPILALAMIAVFLALAPAGIVSALLLRQSTMQDALRLLGRLLGRASVGEVP